MTDAPTQGAPTISGNLPFYKNPEPLSAEKHANLGVLRKDGHLAFAHAAHVVPLTVGEFGPASLFYPIIFAGTERSPLAVMGLRPGENLFVGADGSVDDDLYMPAFVRRYPFVFAENAAQQQLVVCIDTGSDLVGENPDVAFFEGGKPTKFTQDAIEFLQTFERQRQTTSQLVKLFTDLDLFEEKDVTYTPRGADGQAGEPVKIADYFAVSIDKLGKLPADKLAELRDNGALSTIYAHNLSLLNWQRVMTRALRQPAGTTMSA